MRIKSNRNFSFSSRRFSSGMSLLDVLLGILVFVVGMLALASLQGNLTRSSADASARTVGANVAEELIEGFRMFQFLETAEGPDAYEAIVDETLSVTRNNIEYTVDVDVTDYYFLPNREGVTDQVGDLPPNQDTSISDFKYVELDVSWTSGEFQVNEGVESTGRFGSGNFVVSGIIGSTPPLAAAKIAADDDGAPGSPPVLYNPGNRPDIIALTVDTNKFKETTTPEPIIRRADELIETWFDVITYNGTSDAIFLRREEFVSISCACTLRAPAGANKDGRPATLWTGAEYMEGLFEGKPWGESASNQQSQYCDVCCRDHHDSSSSVKYRPWMANGDYVNGGTFRNDHPHYDRNNQGAYVEATSDGDSYLEACRLVRKDGFFRVAQDFNLNQINAFAEDYLISDSDVNEYTNYVNSVADYNLGQINTSTAPAAANTVLSFDGRDTGNPTDIPVVLTGAQTQQLRSRGIYIDPMNSLLQANITNCFGNGDINACEAPDATTVYEIYPYFDVQVTGLARWTEINDNDPVEISNEELNKNGYSRGLAQLAGSEVGRSTGKSTIETGNVGLISTLPVAEVPSPAYLTADLFIRASSGEEPPPPSGDPVVSGNLSNEGGTSDAAILVLQGSTDVTCTKPTNSTFTCTIGPLAGPSPTVTVSNYFKVNTSLLICSSDPAVVEIDHYNESPIAANNWTVFSVPVSGISGVTLTISKSGC